MLLHYFSEEIIKACSREWSEATGQNKAGTFQRMEGLCLVPCAGEKGSGRREGASGLGRETPWLKPLTLFTERGKSQGNVGLGFGNGSAWSLSFSFLPPSLFYIQVFRAASTALLLYPLRHCAFYSLRWSSGSNHSVPHRALPAVMTPGQILDWRTLHPPDPLSSSPRQLHCVRLHGLWPIGRPQCWDSTRYWLAEPWWEMVRCRFSAPAGAVGGC